MQQPNAFLQILIRTAQTGIFEGWLTPTCLPAFQAGPRGLVGPIVRYSFQFSSSHDWPERVRRVPSCEAGAGVGRHSALIGRTIEAREAFSDDLHPVPELFHTHTNP